MKNLFSIAPAKKTKTNLMKRLILMLVICSSFSLTGFANETKVSESVLKSFNSFFKEASDVSWTTVNNYYKVSFKLQDQYVCAFYDEDGQMIALTRNITSRQLPITLQVALKNDYSQCWISDLFEMTNDGGTFYYVTIENGDAQFILKSNSESAWRIYKKSNKQ
jgi:hypothetical protein